MLAERLGRDEKDPRALDRPGRHQIGRVGQDGGEDEAFARFHELDYNLLIVHSHSDQTYPPVDQDMQELGLLTLTEQNSLGWQIMYDRSP
jgi:hypothetical protein